MNTPAAIAPALPALRSDLVIRPLGDNGQFVVKDPRTGAYFTVGEREHFLFSHLDGRQSASAICADYSARFGGTLAEADLDAFVKAAGEQWLLERPSTDPTTQPSATTPQSLLHWRKSLWDPDRFFDWLEPKVGFFWTRGFVLVSAACIFAAATASWVNRDKFIADFSLALQWETLLLFWVVLSVMTLLHECAHGLTCKHFGGEVHEIGVLLVCLTPCFYCNVSDAWLFREKSKRLWVTFAGVYFELFLWALAVFVWCVTVPSCFANRLAFVVASLCGVQALFNFNPLMKLDGYYLLSDWLEQPNLLQRAGDHTKAVGRRLLWGADAPPRPPRARLLLGFGLTSLVFSFGVLAFVLGCVFAFIAPQFGLVGVCGVAFLGIMSMRKLFQGFAAGEVRKMILFRRKQTIAWVAVLSGLAAVLCFVEVEDRAGGTFQVRAAVRAEVRAPLCGFIKDIWFEEGDRVSPGAVVVQLDVPDLASRQIQKRAELSEAAAHLRRLVAGARPEELAEQRGRVARAASWRDLAEKDLERARSTFKEEQASHDQHIAQGQAEVTAAHNALQRARQSQEQGVISEADFGEADKQVRVREARRAQLQADRRAHESLGVLKVTEELARRAKELAEAKAALSLLELGTPPEEVEAHRARVSRLEEEAAYLNGVPAKLTVRSPVAGVVCTPRLKEKKGQYVREGDLLYVVEEPSELEAEVVLDEDRVGRVRPGQVVALKPRAAPLASVRAEVQRVAPAAHGDGQNTLTVYCRVAPPAVSGETDTPAGVLRPGMTGHALVSTGVRPVGTILASRTLRYLRIESWSWF